MAMSALVKEQIEGITPLAISLITAKKFAVSDSRAFKVYRQKVLYTICGLHLTHKLHI